MGSGCRTDGIWRAGLAALLLGIVTPLGGCRPATEESPPVPVAFTDPQDLEEAIDEATGLGLTRRDARGRVVAGLAQSWRVSNDGSFVLFRLRPLMAVGDRLVEAPDVVRALQAAVRAPAHPELRDLLGGGIDVRAPLPDVVEIRLSTPQPELPDLLALPDMAIRPTGSGRRRTPRLPGPLMEAEAPLKPAGETAGGRTLLVPDPGFGFPQETEGMPGVVLLRLDPDSAVLRYQEGDIDLVVGGLMRGFDNVARMSERQGLVVAPARAVARLAVNQTSGPLSDSRVRLALAQAIDREGLAKAFAPANAAEPLMGLIPPNISGQVRGERPAWLTRPLAERQAEARRLVAEAGFGPDGERLRLRLAIGRSREEARLGEWLANDWAALGVDLIVERRSAEGLRRAIDAGEVELALDLVESPVDAPSLFLARLPCGRNRLGLCLPEADQLWQASWKAPTLAERMAAVGAAERLWLEEAHVIPLFQPVRWWLVRPGRVEPVPGVDSRHALAHIRIVPR
ncbi:ABC transporter substrate-binding protein [Thermaurantiacus sp.]